MRQQQQKQISQMTDTVFPCVLSVFSLTCDCFFLSIAYIVQIAVEQIEMPKLVDNWCHRQEQTLQWTVPKWTKKSQMDNEKS